MIKKINAIIALLRSDSYILVTYDKGTIKLREKTFNYGQMKALITYAIHRCVEIGGKRYVESRRTC